MHKTITNFSMSSIMYYLLKQNKEKTIYFILFTFIAAFFLLVTVVFKNDEEIRNKKTNTSFQHQDLSTIKEFLLSKLKSPFINIDYKIKSGDSIQKILKRFKIQNNEIANIKLNNYTSILIYVPTYRILTSFQH